MMAAHLAWSLIDDDMEPSALAETRELAAVADELAPYFPVALSLRSYLAYLDGELDEAVAVSTQGIRWARSGGACAQLLCIRAVARSRQGDRVQADRDHEAAARTWPECDMLAWTAREIGTHSN